MTKAFLAVNGSQGAASARIRETVAGLTDNVVAALLRRHPQGGTFHIEDIQDQVELALMRSGEHDVARATCSTARNGPRRARRRRRRPRVRRSCTWSRTASASSSIVSACSAWSRPRAKGCPTRSPRRSWRRPCATCTTACRCRKCASPRCRRARAIEKDPAYSFVTARLLLDTIRLEVLGEPVGQAEMTTRYASYFPQFIEKGIAVELLDPALAKFDLVRPRSRRAAISSSGISACRPCTTAISCTAAAGASSCRRPSSCASRWASRCARKTAKRGHRVLRRAFEL